MIHISRNPNSTPENILSNFGEKNKTSVKIAKMFEKSYVKISNVNRKWKVFTFLSPFNYLSTN